MAEQSPARRGKHAWKGGDGSAPRPGTPQAKQAKQRKVFGILAVMLALVGIIAAIVYFLRKPPDTTFYPVAISEYEQPDLPVNALAAQDRDALSKVFQDQEQQYTHIFGGEQAKETGITQQKDLMEKMFASWQQRHKQEAIVVYLNALALCNADGEVYLLPALAQPDEPGGWIKLKEVLEKVASCPAENKLVIVDVMRTPVSPRLGVLGHDLAAHVKRTVEELPEGQRPFVLLACAPGQVSHTSQALGRSVFGYYLEQGLRGWADICSDKQNHRVTVQKLYRFVSDRVERWAQKQDRNLHQTPLLLGSGRDFDLTVISKDPTPEEGDPAVEVPGYPDWLRQQWEERDRWWTQKDYRLAPHAFHRLEATLLKAEHQWRGGRDEESLRKDVRQKVDRLTQTLQEVRAAVTRGQPRPLSVAQARKHPQEKFEPEPAAQALRDMLNGLKRLPAKERAAKEEDAIKAFLNGPTPPPNPPGKPAPEPPAKWRDRPLTLSEAVVQVASEEPTEIDFLYRVLLLANEKKPANLRHPLYVETVFLQRLAEELGKGVPRDTLTLALQVVHDGEEVAACDARAFPWSRRFIDRAAARRHEAEVRLFARDCVRPDSAHPLFEEAKVQYAEARRRVETAEKACHTYDEAMTLLPAYVPYLLAVPVVKESERKNWEQCVQGVNQLHQMLANPPAADATLDDDTLRANLDQLESLTTALARSLTDLRRPVTPEALTATLAESTRSEDESRLDSLLELSWLTAAQREAVWKARKAVADLHVKATLKSDQQDNARRVHAKQASPGDTEKAQAQERERTAERAQVLVELLRLGGSTRVADQLAKDLLAARKNAGADAWSAFGQKFKTAWSKGLADEIHATRPLPARERLCRVFPPFDDLPVKGSPSAELERERVLAYRGWLGTRYRYESQELHALDDRSRAEGAGTTAENFYDAATGEYPASDAEETPVRLNWRGATPDLSNKQKSHEQVTLRMTLSGTPVGDVKFPDAITDAVWLRVKVGPPVAPRGGGQTYDLPVDLERPPGAENSRNDPPRAFLVGATAGGLTYHVRVPVLLPGSATKQLRLVVTDAAQDPKNPVDEQLALRPNVKGQTYYVFVHNPTDEEKKVLVQLHSNDPARDYPPQPVTAKKGLTRVEFKSPQPKFEPIKGVLQLKLLDAEGERRQLDEATLRVTVESPAEYVRAAVDYDPEKKKLTARVWPRRKLSEPPCHVTLVLPPNDSEFSLTLAPDANKVLDGDLPQNPDEPLQLFAEGIQLDRDSNQDRGEVSLTVDGYPRALIYRVRFSSDATGLQNGLPVPPAPRLRVRAAASARPGEPYKVHIEVDNAPADAQVRAFLKSARADDFPRMPIWSRQGAREVHNEFSLGETGGLVFNTSVGYWLAPIPIGKLGGDFELKVVLVDPASGRPLKDSARQDLVRTTKVVFDETPPENVEILSVAGHEPSKSSPTLIERPADGALVVVAKGEDQESGIEKVDFFLTKLVEDPKTGKPRLPDGAEAVRFAGTPVEKNDRTRWKARLFVKKEQEGLTPITVRFVNGVGQETFDQTSVNVVAPGAATSTPAGPKTGSIKVKVVVGTLPQPGVTVILKKAKDPGDKEGKPARTNDDGECSFKDLPPGEYVLSCSTTKATEKLMDQQPVEVTAGKEEQVTLKPK